MKQEYSSLYEYFLKYGLNKAHATQLTGMFMPLIQEHVENELFSVLSNDELEALAHVFDKEDVSEAMRADGLAEAYRQKTGQEIYDALEFVIQKIIDFFDAQQLLWQRVIDKVNAGENSQHIQEFIEAEVFTYLNE